MALALQITYPSLVTIPLQEQQQQQRSRSSSSIKAMWYPCMLATYISLLLALAICCVQLHVARSVREMLSVTRLRHTIFVNVTEPYIGDSTLL